MAGESKEFKESKRSSDSKEKDVEKLVDQVYTGRQPVRVDESGNAKHWGFFELDIVLREENAEKKRLRDVAAIPSTEIWRYPDEVMAEWQAIHNPTVKPALWINEPDLVPDWFESHKAYFEAKAAKRKRKAEEAQAAADIKKKQCLEKLHEAERQCREKNERIKQLKARRQEQLKLLETWDALAAMPCCGLCHAEGRVRCKHGDMAEELRQQMDKEARETSKA